MEDWEPGGKGPGDGKNDTWGALAARMSWQVWAMQESPRGPEEAGGEGRRGWKRGWHFTLGAQGEAGTCLSVSGAGGSARGGCPSGRLPAEGRYWAPACPGHSPVLPDLSLLPRPPTPPPGRLDTTTLL